MLRVRGQQWRRCGYGLAMWLGSSAAWGISPTPEGLLSPPATLPDVVDAPPTATAPAEAALAERPKPAGAEVIIERYPNGAVKIERHVVRDVRGSFVKHGPWTMYDEQGHFLGGGDHVSGQRHGPWTRTFRAGEAEMLAGSWTRGFEAPFTSRATFEHGQLHGAWTIKDARDREMVTLNYDQGLRHGKSEWRYSNGKLWREITFERGQPEGDLREFDERGYLVAEEKYQNGHRHGLKTELYPSGAKRAVGEFVMAKEVTELTENWWNGISRFERVGTRGKDVREGKTTIFYENGQPALEGEYHADTPHGTFVWYHPNGQRAIEGHYTNGCQDGDWSWWHDNGELRIQGKYVAGVQDGNWTWFSREGAQVAAAVYKVHDADGGAQIDGLASPHGTPVGKPEPAPPSSRTAERPTVAPAIPIRR